MDGHALVMVDSRMTSVRDTQDELDFVARAAEHFAENPKHWTFGDLRQGSLLAMRWGLGEDCVLVLKLDEFFAPVNYQQAIKRA